jgi:pyruvate,orthophosphate dikinase
MGPEGDGAVVARQLDKVCLVGCSELAIDMAARRCRIAGREIAERDCLCLDGNAGRVLAGRPGLASYRPTVWLQRVEGWKGRRGGAVSATAADECA